MCWIAGRGKVWRYSWEVEIQMDQRTGVVDSAQKALAQVRRSYKRSGCSSGTLPAPPAVAPNLYFLE